MMLKHGRLVCDNKKGNNHQHTLSYKKKTDSHITELVAERNKERHVSKHAKQTAYM